MPGGGVGAATAGRACGGGGATATGAGGSGNESGRISVLCDGLGSRQPEQAALLMLCGGGVRVVVVKAGTGDSVRERRTGGREGVEEGVMRKERTMKRKTERK